MATVRLDGAAETAKVEVDANGNAGSEFKSETLRNWVENQLDSLVQHRLPSDDHDENVTFAEDDGNHPLGRAVNLGDKAFQSKYRIKDNMVTEVNRNAGPVRFTISVLEAQTNDEGKYLPKVVSLSTWDNKTGELKSNTSVTNSWQRIGAFDIPLRIFEVTTRTSARQVCELQLEQVELLKAKE